MVGNHGFLPRVYPSVVLCYRFSMLFPPILGRNQGTPQNSLPTLSIRQWSVGKAPRNYPLVAWSPWKVSLQCAHKLENWNVLPIFFSIVLPFYPQKNIFWSSMAWSRCKFERCMCSVCVCVCESPCQWGCTTYFAGDHSELVVLSMTNSYNQCRERQKTRGCSTVQGIKSTTCFCTYWPLFTFVSNHHLHSQVIPNTAQLRCWTYSTIPSLNHVSIQTLLGILDFTHPHGFPPL